MNKVFLALFSLAPLAAPARAADAFTPLELSAQFPYDLGPAEVDVAAYPKAQQDNYAVLRRACSQCHALARPLNSPIVSREDWTRYVKRMHARTKARQGVKLSPADAKAVIDFLVYDSRLRKIEKKAAFEAQAKALSARFAAARKEKLRLQTEEDAKKARH